MQHLLGLDPLTLGLMEQLGTHSDGKMTVLAMLKENHLQMGNCP
jgi:hypothetical protein